MSVLRPPTAAVGAVYVSEGMLFVVLEEPRPTPEGWVMRRLLLQDNIAFKPEYTIAAGVVFDLYEDAPLWAAAALAFPP